MARRPWQDIGAFAVKVSDVSVRIAGASESVGLYARASLALEDGSSSPYWAAAAPSIETFERAAGQELFEVQLGFVQISAYFELTIRHHALALHVFRGPSHKTQARLRRDSCRQT